MHECHLMDQKGTTFEYTLHRYKEKQLMNIFLEIEIDRQIVDIIKTRKQQQKNFNLYIF